MHIIGTQFGTVISLPLSGVLCDLELDNGWPFAFYVPGIIGVIWFIFWFFLVFDSPAVHPRIAEDEKRYILASTGVSRQKKVGIHSFCFPIEKSWIFVIFNREKTVFWYPLADYLRIYILVGYFNCPFRTQLGPFHAFNRTSNLHENCLALWLESRKYLYISNYDIALV